MTRTLGTCYYPEHWSEEYWAADAARMVEVGITWVRIGEFAWSRLEPLPGRYDWAWMDRAIATLTGAGLRVVLGTPSATPPRWMLDRHPDMLAHDTDGRPRRFGSRRHYCFSHAGYRADAAEMAGRLAQRYASAVSAWQTDNEYDCHDTVLSYSPAARAAFRDWLSRRYQSAEALNRAWGNVFWSMEYGSIDEVDLPNLTVTEPNPAHVMDFRRFASDQVAAFNAAQVAAIRAHSDAPIGHNYMGRTTTFDHHAVGAQMEIATWDSYPLGFLEDRVGAEPAHQRRYAHAGDPDFQAFHHDLYRGVCPRWWVMEQQPGPVNWAPHNPAPAPGMVRLWAWEAFVHGAECVSYFRWRQAPFAQEQMHSGLLRPDGAPAMGYAEAAEVAAEIAARPEVGAGPSEAAIVFDYPSAWAWDTQPQGREFDYFGLVFALYRGLRAMGLSVDVLPASHRDFADYGIVLVPGLMTLAEDLAAALAASGAQVVYGPRTNSRTEEFRIPVPLPPAILDLDVTVDLVETIRPDMPRPVQGGGAAMVWVERLTGGAEAVLSTRDGAPVLLRNGALHYLGAWPDDTLARRLAAMLADRAGLAALPMPEGVRRRRAADGLAYLNYGAEPATIAGLTIPAHGIAWA